MLGLGTQDDRAGLLHRAGRRRWMEQRGEALGPLLAGLPSLLLREPPLPDLPDFVVDLDLVMVPFGFVFSLGKVIFQEYLAADSVKGIVSQPSNDGDQKGMKITLPSLFRYKVKSCSEGEPVAPPIRENTTVQVSSNLDKDLTI